MKRHFAMTKAQRAAEWKAAFSDAVLTADPRHAGRIEWPSADHFYFQGMTPTEAAALYIKNRQEPTA